MTKPRLFTILFAVVITPACAEDGFKNLQVLPKDISRKDLMWTMRGFCFSLGVRCEHCHAGKDTSTLHEMNFPSDEKETKKTARAMLRMVDALNRDYISKLSSQPVVKVECVTCHRGLSRPRTLQAVLTEEIDKGGVASAVELYRKLRKEAYGRGEYDFSETSLNLLSESLVNGGRPREASAIMELNVEVNSPLSTWAYSDLAIAHQASGETTKAEADFRKILQMNPEDSWAKGELEKLVQSHR
jgi:tetratricopeptide (TPR) repeat protein